MHPIRPAVASPARRAFTLIELLVVISIIALLIGILLPALGAARGTAKTVASLSNLRQIGIGLAAYNAEQKDYYPMHSSDTGNSSLSGAFGAVNGNIKPRWADYLFTFLGNTEVYLSPNLTSRELEAGFTNPFFHPFSATSTEQAARRDITPTPSPDAPAAGNEPRHGGYGYNFQYLGNARFDPTFHARAGREIVSASDTIAIGDTAGSRGGSSTAEPGDGRAAVYALDPPIGSVRGAHPTYRAYYESGPEENAGAYDPDFLYTVRSAPAERNQGGTAGFTFADGHAEAISRADVDDSNNDGIADNGRWNGLGRPADNR